MLSSVLDMKERELREVMVPRTRTSLLQLVEGKDQAIKIFRETGFSRLPVYKEKEDDIAGIIHAKDLLLHPDEEISDLLRPARYFPETKRVLSLLMEMKNERFHFAVVVDEFGNFVGIVTLEDLLEEIVGEIEDEYDLKNLTQPFRTLKSGEIEIDASLPLHEVNRHLSTSIPQSGDYETLAGFIVSAAGEVPALGSEVRWKEWIFKVVEGDARRITLVRAWSISNGEGKENG